MASAKQPDDSSSYEEILRELVYRRMVRRGLADSDAQRTVSEEDLESKIQSWQK